MLNTLINTVKRLRIKVEAVVLQVHHDTPMMRRIVFGGDLQALLAHEDTALPAAWLKVEIPSGESRAYTIQRMNVQAGTLELAFVLHQPLGPVSAWAAQAQPGDKVRLAGPRQGRFDPPADASWLLLAGDATALPAMHSILHQWPAHLPVQLVAEVAGSQEQQRLPNHPRLQAIWLAARHEPGWALYQHLSQHGLPAGPGYIWLAGEATAIRALQVHYRNAGIPVSAKGYWKQGEARFRD